MKLSSKSRYGLKAMFMLAKEGAENVSLSQLSKEIGVSSAYLEQLMRLLKKAEVITSERGVTGGYLLARKPFEITIGEIIRALEDNLELIDCISSPACTEKCPTRVIWKKIYDSINDTLDGITLQDMLDESVN